MSRIEERRVSIVAGGAVIASVVIAWVLVFLI
jgi:hypothetical protein